MFVKSTETAIELAPIFAKDRFVLFSAFQILANIVQDSARYSKSPTSLAKDSITCGASLLPRLVSHPSF